MIVITQLPDNETLSKLAAHFAMRLRTLGDFKVHHGGFESGHLDQTSRVGLLKGQVDMVIGLTWCASREGCETLYRPRYEGLAHAVHGSVSAFVTPNHGTREVDRDEFFHAVRSVPSILVAPFGHRDVAKIECVADLIGESLAESVAEWLKGQA